ncbi:MULTISPECIES: hypothetical protein [unclassified Microcoleus]|nr:MULTISPECIES: hypothetical protein [unclassified Microcoleus]MCC3447119.1 hypothetical protein [Microcoleus sp. PH2017_09_SFU_O_A]MCC3473960.1 hypothetical protein [Microcoleus sp. PH2017_13_LAR_U_A]MCC3564477.1 hypothetical protein [Microcoleus sp. PH2017_31_RDM_U_A]MCC3623944.1 hypothetical protein [Microcoleus sp. PH2017_36_ELK_O_B]
MIVVKTAGIDQYIEYLTFYRSVIFSWRSAFLENISAPRVDINTDIPIY